MAAATVNQDAGRSGHSRIDRALACPRCGAVGKLAACRRHSGGSKSPPRPTPFLSLWQGAHKRCLWPSPQRVGARHLPLILYLACDPTFRSPATGFLLRQCQVVACEVANLGHGRPQRGRGPNRLSAHKRPTNRPSTSPCKKLRPRHTFFVVLTLVAQA